MAENNNTNKKRSVTGSYPGVTGSYKPTSAYPKSERANVNARSQAVKDQAKPHQKQGFDFKAWFSGKNVKAFMVQLRFYGIIVAVSMLLTAGIITMANDVFAFIRPDESVVVNIEQNAGIYSISKTLKKEGVIEHPMLFRLYTRLKKANGKLKFGTYTLNSNLGYDQIISKLKKDSVKPEAFTITLTEGCTQDEVAQMLTSGGYASAADVEYALTEYEYDKFKWVSSLPERRCRLEGYLPAGEYEFYIGESAVSMISKMLERFEQTVLTDENKKLITASGMSTDDVVTLASLIQSECGSKNMYEGAAAVLLNRLKSKTDTDNFLRLTSPINYVLPEPKEVLDADDKRTDSDYNTYMYSGLPKGPICNPSIEAINAVLSPETSEYMYFISDGDKAYYALTSEEHRSSLRKIGKSVKGTDTLID